MFIFKFRLSGPLLSRFDLLFILLDTPDAELDLKLSSHIISMHSNNTPNRKNSVKNQSTLHKSSHNLSSSNTNDQNLSLANRLKLKHPKEVDPLPAQLLRKVWTDMNFNWLSPRQLDEFSNFFQVHIVYETILWTSNWRWSCKGPTRFLRLFKTKQSKK